MTHNFDRLAPEWETTRVGPERLQPIAAALDALPSPPARVLDLGTGSGRAARLAAERFADAEVTGADVSSGMVREAERLAATSREHYLQADASDLPFPDAAFDLVMLNNMIPFFDELARVTAPGGSVIVAFTMGDRTPIYVPFARVRSELERRGFSHVADFDAGTGTALLAKKADRS
jgi:ubiquinone/menaquinone biosynthesis C-methylase UbiE